MPTSSNTPQNVRYIAAIDGVVEISLVGLADLTFWQDKLRSANLFPTVREGRAECLLSATNARYQGIRFRELSFSVFVTNREGGDSRDGAYFAYAFNSSRMFAWIERTLFSTPYYYGPLEVSLSDSASVVAHSSGKTVFQAEIAGLDRSSSRTPIQSGDFGWSGPLYLPSLRAGGPIVKKLFYVKLSGDTRTYPFDATRDRFELKPLASHAALQEFSKSRFEPREWMIRPSAHHARSKTIPRK